MGRRPRVGTLLVCLALVPLLGLTWLAVSRVKVTTAERSAAEALSDSTREAVLIVNLEAALDQEQTWTQGEQLALDLGLNTALIGLLLGVDLATERGSSTEWVDRLVGEISDRSFAGGIALRLSELRDGDLTGTALATGYQEVRDLVGAHRDALFREVFSDVVAVGDSPRLVESVLIVEATATMRGAFAGQVGSFFSLQFDDLIIADDPIEELVTQRQSYTIASERLAGLAPPGSAAARGQSQLAENVDVTTFLAAVDDFVADILDGDGIDAEEISLVAGSFRGDQASFERLGASFQAASVGSDAHVDLVATAGAGVLSLVDGEASNARATALWVTVVALAIGCVTALVTIATARAIIRPLRLLSDSADALQRGDLTRQVPITGPREMRSVGRALSEAVDNLRLGERQADALAVGSLDDPVFDVEAKGHFGSSLQAAVDRLRTSLAEREEYRRRLSHQAAHDGLTGVPNRRAVIDHLEQAVARTARSDATLAAFFVDVDGFKSVNDLHGHPAGDALLRTVAQRLGEAVRGGDLVGRLGGDEFLIVAEPVTDVDDAYALAERIRTTVTKPVSTPAGIIEPTISVGVAVSEAGRFTADELIRDADLAVYLAKERGRNRTEVCDDDMRQQAARESDLEQAVREALDRNEFVLHYQPIVAADDARPVGVEALIRWEHPERGLVAPAEFIAFAERSDLIIDIDRWVIASAVEQLRTWRGVPVLGELAVAINVSGRHLRGASLSTDVETALADSRVDPALLVVEVTESALLDDLVDVAADLDRVRALGVRVAIDDFGTGYTSLAHLRTLPLDILKLDQSFVATLDTDDRSIVGLVIDTAHLLDVEIVIEGVETASHAAVVRDLGCDLMQGFYFGMPAPASRIEQLGGPSCLPHAEVT